MDSRRDVQQGEILDPDATMPFVRVGAAAAPPRTATLRPPAGVRAIPREITSTLLPSERVTFGSTPHPVVLVRPLIALLVVAAAFSYAWHVLAPPFRPYAEVLGVLGALGCVWLFARGLGEFAGMRVVATNRRIFAIRGVVFRRVTPIGNTELASSQLVQGIFGRMYGFGTIDVQHAGRRLPLFRDMRDAGALYRECQAVANGVDGDTWTPAVRQTIIP